MSELRARVEMEIHHNISPLIGWLRMDAVHGKTDFHGQRYDQWNERAGLAVDAIVEYVGEFEYEYAVACDEWLNAGWNPEDEDAWTTREEAGYQLEDYLSHYAGNEYRIVKRRKAGRIESV